MPKLGILAGGGTAPQRVLEKVQQAGRAFTLIGLEGQAEPGLGGGEPCHWLPLGAGGRLVELLRSEAVEEIVFIGRVRRPSLFELRPDAYTMQKLVKIGFSMLGDDGLLRGIEKIFAEEGFRVVGVQDVFTQFLTPPGQLGKIVPTAQDVADMQRAAQIARQLGGADVGQAVIVQQGLVLGLEAIEGTDALIARAGTLKRAGGGGVLVKMCKPQQDRRLDLPTIGLATVQAVQAAGLAGLAAEAGSSLFFDADAAIAAADAAGLFVCGYTDGSTP